MVCYAILAHPAQFSSLFCFLPPLIAHFAFFRYNQSRRSLGEGCRLPYALLSADVLLPQVAACALEFCEYVFFLAAALIAVRFLFPAIPRHVFRKLLHIVAFSCLVEMTLAARSWQAAALTSLLFAAAVYPLLCLCERFSWYAGLFVQKKPGEVKKSLLLLFGMYALLISVCWGMLGKAYLAIAATLMWGVGDAAAALFGKAFGTHPVSLPLADPHKTWEGSAAMALFAFLAGSLGMLLSHELSAAHCFLFALVTAPFSALTELISRDGNDTVSVPIVSAAVLLVLSLLF